MRRALLTGVALCGLTFLLQAQQSGTRIVEVGKGYSETSVNTTVFRNSSLVTHGREQYIAYYAPDGTLVLGKRKLGDTRWTLQRTPYKGNVKDAHNVISLMLDGKGYLHLAFDHHGHPLKYCRSLKPRSLQLGDLQPMTGVDEGDVTYPEFYTLKGGDLLFAYRSGSSGRGNLVLNRYDVKSGSWHRVQDVLIDGEEKRNAYWQLYVDAQGTIHLSWVWRETWMVETNHDLCYACSRDNGVTWQKSDGTPYDLPIRADNAEYAWRIPQNSELINQTSMSADAEGHPYIATYWRDAESDVPQYRLVWHDGHQWHARQVGNRQTPFTLKGGGTKMIPIARPRLVTDGRKAYYIFRDEERGSRVSLAATDDVVNGHWTVTDLTDFSVDAWEPSHDTELWKQRRRLHLFVQPTHQGDGERTVNSEPTTVYVLEVKTP
ncbi:MAG: BNR repeat-containing protein [Bacteroides sp.]|nr:BNR repeat-containing protein [Bacteroides sp.]